MAELLSNKGFSYDRVVSIHDLSDQSIEACLQFLNWKDFVFASSVSKLWKDLATKIQQFPEWKQHSFPLTFMKDKNERKSIFSELGTITPNLLTHGKPQMCLVFVSLKSHRFTPKRQQELCEVLLVQKIVDMSCPILIVDAERPFNDLDAHVVSMNHSGMQSDFENFVTISICSIPKLVGKIKVFHIGDEEDIEARDLQNGAMIFCQNSSLLNRFADTLVEALGTNVPITGGIVKNSLWENGHLVPASLIGFGVSGRVRLHPIVLKGFKPVGSVFTVQEVERAINGNEGGIMSIIRSLVPSEHEGRSSQPVESTSALTYLDSVSSADDDESYIASAPRMEVLQQGEGITIDPAYRFGDNEVVIPNVIQAGEFGQFYTRCPEQCLKDAESSFKRLQNSQKQVLAGIGAVCCGRQEELCEGKSRLSAAEAFSFVAQFPGSAYTAYMCGGEIGPPEYVNAHPGEVISFKSEVHGFTNCVGVVVVDRD